MQAQAFLAFAAKCGVHGVAVDDLFRYWAASKDFHPEEMAAIWHVVRMRCSMSTPADEPSDRTSTRRFFADPERATRPTTH